MSKSLKVLAAASVLAFGMGATSAAFAYECNWGSKTAKDDNMTTVMEDGEQSTPPASEES